MLEVDKRVVRKYLAACAKTQRAKVARTDRHSLPLWAGVPSRSHHQDRPHRPPRAPRKNQEGRRLREESKGENVKNRPCHSPPLRAEYLLDLITPPDRTEEFAGDLFEKYQRIRAKHSVRKSNFYYWWQVIRSIPGMFRIKFTSLTIFAGLAKLYRELSKYLSSQ